MVQRWWHPHNQYTYKNVSCLYYSNKFSLKPKNAIFINELIIINDDNNIGELPKWEASGYRFSGFGNVY